MLQLEKYAPARWPAAPTAACAELKSGALARSAAASKSGVALDGEVKVEAEVDADLSVVGVPGMAKVEGEGS